MTKEELDTYYNSEEHIIWLRLCHEKPYYNKEILFKPLNYDEINQKQARLE